MIRKHDQNIFIHGLPSVKGEQENSRDTFLHSLLGVHGEQKHDYDMIHCTGSTQC